MVRDFAEILRSGVTLRVLLIAAATAGVLGLLARFVFGPIYRGAAGFLPFDLQFPLTKFMIAVELGAIDKAAAMMPYAFFVAADLTYMLAAAGLFTLGWLWLFAKFPMPLFAFLRRGGVAMLPFYVVILDIVTKVEFFRLIGGLSGEDYADALEFSVTVHRLKFALMEIRNYLTAGFVLAAVFGIFFARTSRARS